MLGGDSELGCSGQSWAERRWCVWTEKCAEKSEATRQSCLAEIIHFP